MVTEPSQRPAVPCPRCSTPRGQYMQHTSEGNRDDYYRCNSCGHLWKVERQLSQGGDR